MSAKRERITRLYLPDCPWGPRCQEERRTLSVSSLRSTCRALEGLVRLSWMRPGASWKSHGWANLPMGTCGEVLIKHPRGYAHLTNLSSSSFTLFPLSFSFFVVSTFFLFLYSYSAFSHLSQRKALTSFDWFHSSVKISRVVDGLKENHYDVWNILLQEYFSIHIYVFTYCENIYVAITLLWNKKPLIKCFN